MTPLRAYDDPEVVPDCSFARLAAALARALLGRFFRVGAGSARRSSSFFLGGPT